MLRWLGKLLTRASVETINMNDPAAWDSVLDDGFRAATGEVVTKQKALSFPAVWQSVSLISGDVAQFPLEVFKRISTGKERDRQHRAHRIVAREPNTEVTPFQFWRRYMVSGLLYNRAYAWIDRNELGEPIGLYNLLPDRTRAERIKLKGVSEPQLFYVTETGGKLQPLLPSEVLHIEGICCDNLDGCDLIHHARNAIAIGLAQQDFQASFFKNGASAGGILQVPPGFTKKAKDKLQEGFEKQFSGKDNWFKTVILREGATFHRQTFSLSELEMSQATDAAARQIARLFNLSPSKLGLSDSVSYNSKAEDNQAYLDSTLSPWLVAIQQECWRKLLTREERENDSHFFEFNTNSILRLNPVERAKIFAIAIRNGWMLPGEVREIENLPPLPVAAQPEDSGGANDKQFDNDGADPNNVRRVVFAIGSRARHKAESSPAAFLEWVDTDLKYHREDCRKLGVDDALVTPIVTACRELAEHTKAADLVSAVDGLMTRFECAA